mmetsp:Transcript_1760/g.6228  ORF Transcript_1760/g.6228 Transcript_1760/m.6228 type:complete len:117 (-) Transcript_1760:2971-3321(-)
MDAVKESRSSVSDWMDWRGIVRSEGQLLEEADVNDKMKVRMMVKSILLVELWWWRDVIVFEFESRNSQKQRRTLEANTLTSKICRHVSCSHGKGNPFFTRVSSAQTPQNLSHPQSE